MFSTVYLQSSNLKSMFMDIRRNFRFIQLVGIKRIGQILVVCFSCTLLSSTAITGKVFESRDIFFLRVLTQLLNCLTRLSVSLDLFMSRSVTRPPITQPAARAALMVPRRAVGRSISDALSPSPARPISLRDVAKLAEVSVATVSMVLNDNPRISRATQIRVQQVIDKTGYRPNRLAQSLSSRYTRVLAVLLPALRHGFGDAYFGELISGVCDKAGKMGYKVMLEQAKPEFIKARQHIEMYERRYVDGILAMGVSDRHHFLEEFTDRRYPLVVTDNYFGTLWDLDHVVCNYRLGADQAMDYLFQLGHRKIGLIHGAVSVHTSRDVIDAYENKLRLFAIPSAATWREDGRFTEEGGAIATAALLKNHPDLTAIFASNDKMALGALHYLHRHGIDVPGQVSVVGFDDLQQSAYVRPSLTTVHLPLYDVGAMACERLIERIHGTIQRVDEVLKTHLVVRESTAMVRANEHVLAQ
jgi:LacI family transcriptional regulator